MEYDKYLKGENALRKYGTVIQDKIQDNLFVLEKLASYKQLKSFQKDKEYQKIDNCFGAAYCLSYNGGSIGP